MMTRGVLLMVGLIVAVVFAALVARAVEWNAVGAALAAAQPAWLALALCTLACDYALRIERWRRMLARRDIVADFASVAPPLLAGFALNNVLPLRAGDFARMLMAKRALGAPLSVAVGTVLIERVFDLVVIIAALALGTWAIASSSLPFPMVISATVLAAIAVVSLFVCTFLGRKLARRVEAIGRRLGRAPRAFHFIASLLETLAILTHARAIVVLAGLSVLIWVCEGFIVFLCARSLGLSMPWLGAALILAAANLGTLLPGAPGNFGTFHFFAMATAGTLAIDNNNGAALAILVHAIIWLPITLVGGVLAISSVGNSPALSRKAIALHSIDAGRMPDRIDR